MAPMAFLSPFLVAAQHGAFVFLWNTSGLWTGQVHTINFISTVSKSLKLFSQHISSREIPPCLAALFRGLVAMKCAGRTQTAVIT